MTVNKPLTEVLVVRGEKQSLVEFSDFFLMIATRLKENGQFSIVEGEKTTIIAPDEPLEVELKYEKKYDKHQFEIEFEWLEGQSNEKLTIK
ncbi:amphi-Trp domain-containing protein [Enterococcus sp. ALS3]|uniref:Amphi-Trp domain-containing protein n=2 Tax=Enterococcus alishanensis TaxID=1303817 RepID=A0ABS6TDC3_9ENTE|nr:amphi-Trp domain-containing protein [Enterococcus alishanensis]